MTSWSRRLTAWTSLMALVVGLAMPMLPGLHTVTAASDDCATTGRTGGRIQLEPGGPSPSAPEHCVMCHWLRTARSASTGLVASADPPPTVPAVLNRSPIDVPSHHLVVERPSRAPPLAA
jgi:hypothetical protein